MILQNTKIIVLYNTIIFKIPIINLFFTYWIHKNLHKLLSGFNFMKFFLYLFLACICTHIFLYICKIIIFFSSSSKLGFFECGGGSTKNILVFGSQNLNDLFPKKVHKIYHLIMLIVNYNFVNKALIFFFCCSSM